MSSFRLLEDENYQRSIWDGQIPVMFRVGARETPSSNLVKSISPCLLMVSRLSWFAVIRKQVHEFFAPVFDVPENQMWFEFRGVALKWHVPVGVLFDCLHVSTPQNLPFDVFVHFSNPPDSKSLLPVADEEAIRWIFINNRKSAELLKYRNVKRMTCLSRNEVNSLWESLLKSDIDMYFRVTKRMPSISSPDSENALRNVPVRMFMVHGDSSGFVECPSCIQRPIEPHNPDGSPITLKDGIRVIFPEHFQAPTSSPGEEEANNASGVTLSLTDSDSDSISSSSFSKRFVVFIQGISPDLSTPLVWLSENLSHPDGWLYIVVTNKVAEK